MWDFIKRLLTNWKLWVFSVLALFTWGAIAWVVKSYKEDNSGLKYTRS